MLLNGVTLGWGVRVLCVPDISADSPVGKADELGSTDAWLVPGAPSFLFQLWNWFISAEPALECRYVFSSSIFPGEARGLVSDSTEGGDGWVFVCWGEYEGELTAGDVVVEAMAGIGCSGI